jgi:DNA-binding transcriptional ArsR family regulator
MDEDGAFRALADPSRRLLLDALFRTDGQTLHALEAHLGTMSRFGVMKHLRVLEEAGLVVVRRRGREKLHFLNPMPIRLIHDRWVSKFAAPIAATLSDLKTALEKQTMEKVFVLYIVFKSAWTTGSPYTGTVAGTNLLIEGENVEVDPPRKLVQTYRALWSEDAKREGTTRVTWEIEQVADSCQLTVIHDELREDASPEIYGGWPMILSGLKTLLETGELLTTPGSLAYVRS